MSYELKIKLVWGRTTVYLRLFGMNISSQSSYFVLQIRRGISLSLIRLDSASPPQGICIPQPAHDRLAQSPTGEAYLLLQSVGGQSLFVHLGKQKDITKTLLYRRNLSCVTPLYENVKDQVLFDLIEFDFLNDLYSILYYLE